MSDSIDLTEFAELGKIPWEKRAKKVRERFGNVDSLDLGGEQDMDLFGRVVRDILKLEQASPGRPGPRPNLDVSSATRRINQLFGNDFSILQFPDALQVLTGEATIRQIAEKVGLNKDLVYRLKNGKVEPDGYYMKQIANAYGKHPSYFLEWRMLYITQTIMRRLEWSPETTVDLFQTLDRQRREV